jgi:hypothetical protein
MTNSLLTILFLLGVCAIALALFKSKGNETTDAPSEIENFQAQPDFLTAAERSFYGALRLAVQDKYVIFAKVRAADVVRPGKRESRSNWKSDFNRIALKHVDFVLCHPDTLKVLSVIELDDSSHRTLERGIRDDLIDSAMKSAGIPILRVPAKHSYAPTQLREQLTMILPPLTLCNSRTYASS